MRLSLAPLFVLILGAVPFAAPGPVEVLDERPNVLWITIDDCGPDFGCYGGGVVQTPHLDSLAAAGQRFEACFVSTPVCSPVRSAMITGCYATTIGSHQHRSARSLPKGVRPLTELMLEAGWRPTFLPHRRVKPEPFAAGIEPEPGTFPVVSGSNKQDYNFNRDEPALFGEWRPAQADQPFFGLIDFHAPKVGQGTGRAHRWAGAAGRAVDPASLDLPPYWADEPAVREAYARYFEGVALLDAEVGQVLAWLEREGLRQKTLIFVVGDHGIAMLRHKQWCYDTGLRVPLIVQGPGVEPATRPELVSTIDLAAATLTACGLDVPSWMEGRDFLAPDATPRERICASRDRCDETEDRVRALRTGRWKLIHNLRPELPWVGRNAYTRRVFPNVELLLAAKAAGKLTPTQAPFLADRKPEWELYDLQSDPLELQNLAGRPEHAAIEGELRADLEAWTARTDAANPFPEPPAHIAPDGVVLEVAELRRQRLALRRPPNVLLVLADDLGYGELGCYGQELIRTPNLDRLAAEGQRFTRFYAGHCVCAPSRSVLLTGMHTGHGQIRGNSSWASARNPLGEGQEPLLEGTLTTARWLQQRGYATACIGKWGLGGPGTTGEPHHQGFDRFFGYLCQKQAHDYYPDHLWRDGEKVELDNPGFTPKERWSEPPADPSAYGAFSGPDYAPDLMLEEALGWMREHVDEPFFLYYATPVPHVALQVPQDSLAEYLDEGWDEEPYLGQKGYVPHPAPRAAYAAMVSRLDRDVGRLLAEIDELGLAEDTLVLFTSDNGPSYAGGSDSAFFRSAGELRGLKGSLYEGGLRVPLIARWSGTLCPGDVIDQPWGFQDLFPTLCELLHEEPPEGLDGASFLSRVLGEVGLDPGRSFYWETGRVQALCYWRWKLLRTLGAEGEERFELYDLDADPAETTDLSAEDPELFEYLRGLLEVSRRPAPRFPSPFDDGD